MRCSQHLAANIVINEEMHMSKLGPDIYTAAHGSCAFPRALNPRVLQALLAQKSGVLDSHLTHLEEQHKN